MEALQKLYTIIALAGPSFGYYILIRGLYLSDCYFARRISHASHFDTFEIVNKCLFAIHGQLAIINVI